jgi:release factor glutamine methyltransferase
MAQTPNLADSLAGEPDIGRLLAQGRDMLLVTSDSPRLDAELLLAHVLRRPRSYLGAHSEMRPDAATAERYRALVVRRTRGEPIAYLTGEREFWSMPLAVDASVLVPRPETELAVERCLALRGPEPSVVADLGTGSGAIALALQRERPAWQITATDRSDAALRVACANAVRLGLSAVRFVQGDWFEPLAGTRYDVVVSNPPYVAAADADTDGLRYEPALALSPGPTGMEALRLIVRQAAGHLQADGWLVLEHGADQREKLRSALVAAGYARVRCYADLAGHDRVTEAQWART